jgi:hypothetical protein
MKKITSFIFFIISTANCYAQQVTFQKTYGGTSLDVGYSLHQTTDGGYIIVGQTWSFGLTSLNVYLIKTDVNGDTLWTKTFDGPGGAGLSVRQSTDGGYIVTGRISNSGAGNMDIYLLKTDSTGNLIWAKTFGGLSDEQGSDVQQTTDGGFIITGYTSSFGAGYDDVYLIRTDSIGDTLWVKTFGGTGYNDYAAAVQQTTDEGFIIAGTSESFGMGYSDVYLIKTNSNGDTLWTKTFGETFYENHGSSVQQTTDGGYIITGDIRNISAGSSTVYLIKTDSTGNSLWTKSLGGINGDLGFSVQQTLDGGYVIAGYTYSFGAGAADVYLIKTDVNGDTLWSKTFGGTSNDFSYSIEQTTDGGYIILASTTSFGAGNDIYLIKTDSMGNSGCNQGNPATIVITPATQVTNPATIVTSPLTIVTTPTIIVGSGGTVTTLCSTVGINEIQYQEELLLFPNPFSNNLTITSKTNQPLEITLYDITSRKLLHQQFTNSITLNTSQLSKGIYIYELHNKNGVIKKGKVVKE